MWVERHCISLSICLSPSELLTPDFRNSFWWKYHTDIDSPESMTFPAPSHCSCPSSRRGWRPPTSLARNVCCQRRLPFLGSLRWEVYIVQTHILAVHTFLLCWMSKALISGIWSMICLKWRPTRHCIHTWLIIVTEWKQN